MKAVINDMSMNGCDWMWPTVSLVILVLDQIPFKPSEDRQKNQEKNPPHFNVNILLTLGA